MRFTKRTVYFFCTCACLGLIIAGMLSRDVLAARLHEWRLLPAPEYFSELYFSPNQERRPDLAEGRPHSVAFTIGNFERQSTAYRYELTAHGAADTSELPLAQGDVRVPAQAARTVNLAFLGPKIQGRTALTVRVTYTGTSPETRNQSRMTQTIHYWLLPAGLLKEGAQHAVR